MELVTSIAGSKAPGDGAAVRMALGLQRGDPLAQVLHAGYPTRQTPTRKETDLDLGQIQPAAMFGRGMELHPLQDASRLCRREGFLQGRRRVRVQIILHDADAVGLRIDLIHQPANAVGIVELGAVLCHLDMVPAGKGVDEEKQIGRAQALVRVIDPLRLSWLHWLWRPHMGLGDHEFFVEADPGEPGSSASS
jgi:hypothetical protein